MSFLETLALRRSIYKLGTKDFPLTKARVTDIVTQVVAVTPSSYNGQPVRAVILYGERHQRLWDTVIPGACRAAWDDALWAHKSRKFSVLGAAYGTVLVYADMAAVERDAKRFPMYAGLFPAWTHNTAGAVTMNIWSALAAEGVGANLAHYNPVVDQAVRQYCELPEDWLLTGKLVFGAIEGPPKVKTTIDGAVTVLE